MLMWKIILIALSLGDHVFVCGSHFRGGTVSWTHLSSTGNTHQMKFYFRFGWRRDYFTPGCTEAMVKSQQVGYDGGTFNLDSRGSSSVFPRSVAIKCTVFEPDENWAYGFNDFVANITATGPFSIQFTGSVWIEGLYFGAQTSWSVGLFNIDLGIRSDTGKVNQPPSTFSLPIVRVQRNCRSVITIPNVDQDGNDVVTCRYAVNSTLFLECGGICGQFTHFTLNKNCSIYYDGLATDSNYLIPVALMLNDHPPQTITVGGRTVTPSDSLSSVPLQLIVSIFPSNDACDAVPTYPLFGIAEDAVISIAETQGLLNNTLYAYASAPSIAIIRFIILGPLGLQYSPVYLVDTGIYGTDITWIPTSDQGGTHKICYHAVDAKNKAGKQRCFSVVVPDKADLCDADEDESGALSVFDHATQQCTCTVPCWELSSDEKSCIPLMNVSCNGVDIDITIQGCASNRTIVAGSSSWYFSQTQCQSVIRNSNHQLKFGVEDCGVSREISSVLIEYEMNIWVWHGIQSGMVIRGRWLSIPVVCTLSSSQNFTRSFVPNPDLIEDFLPKEVSIVGMGTFTLSFKFFRNISFTSQYGINYYPLEVSVNDVLYFAIGAVGQPGLVLFTHKCEALTNNVATAQALRYAFIENGCLVDPTLKRYNSPPMENRFSMQAFEFEANLLTERQDSIILIQCEIVICDASANNTRCSQGCLPSIRRRKRDVEEEEDFVEENHGDDDDVLDDLSESPPQSINTKILFRGSSKEKGHSDGFLKWILIALGIVVLLISVTAVTLVIVWKRTHGFTKSKNVNVDANGDVCDAKS